MKIIGKTRGRPPGQSAISLLTQAVAKSVFTGLCGVVLATLAMAQDPADLTTKSLEELMNIKVTSVSKKEENLFRTPAAVYVITREEISRSGMTSIPELLRLVPGLDVARIDGTKWAISARGFNGRIANKLLVLIDGRSVYAADTSGVYWEAQNLPLEDIERIEVIRGPGGALWGANAVNGVINIITRQAKDTQGGLVVAGGGTEDRGFGSVRYGGRAGDNAYYRVYGRYFNTSGLVDAAGRDAGDGRSVAQGGGRVDWNASDRDRLTFQGDIYDSGSRETSILISLAAPFAPLDSTPVAFNGGDLLGRWNHVFSERSDMALQVYFDRSRREITDIDERTDTLDLDFQHHIAAGDRHDIVWGLGYRLISDQTNSNSGTPVQFNPKSRSVQLFSGFLQDEFALVKDRLQLTVGAKLEHNDYSGFEIQPSIRLLWTPSSRQTFWAAISRAVRTPTRIDQDIRANRVAFPGAGGLTNVLAIFGNTDEGAEDLLAYEFGYRVQPRKKLSLDIAAFYNVYNHLEAPEPGAPPFFESDPPPPHVVIPVTFGNLMRGETHGVEASAILDLSSRWKVHGSYSFLRMHLHLDPMSQSGIGPETEGGSPQHQFQIHSDFTLPRNIELNASLYRVSRLVTPPVPGYTRLDARLAWHVKESIELSAVVQNLLNDHHPEFLDTSAGVLTSQAKRAAYGKLTWHF
jgi:iron complex outermembrane receptor protein